MTTTSDRYRHRGATAAQLAADRLVDEAEQLAVDGLGGHDLAALPGDLIAQVRALALVVVVARHGADLAAQVAGQPVPDSVAPAIRRKVLDLLVETRVPELAPHIDPAMARTGLG